MASAKGRAARFFRAGGVDQVELRDGADVERLVELDQKLWVALAMPTKGVALDARTLALLDTDGDGRIRAPEIQAAIRFAVEHLRSPDDLFHDGKEGAKLPLRVMKDGLVQKAARRILENLGKRDADAITLDDVGDTAKVFAETTLNGDGVIIPESAGDDAALKKMIEDIVAAHGGVADRSGKQGIDRATLKAFCEEVRALESWWRRADTDRALLPLGDATDGAQAALAAVRAKIEDYFARCRLVAFDARLVDVVQGAQAELAAALGPAGRALDEAAQGDIQLPLARVEAGRALPLVAGLHPGWRARVEAFAAAVKPLREGDAVASETMTEEELRGICVKLAPNAAWTAERPAAKAWTLGLPRLRELATALASGAEGKLEALIDKDAALADEVAQVEAVERLIRYRRDLLTVLRNFVNFSEFYAKKGALFQAGTLFLDGRACSLTLEVTDAGKHATLAALSGTFLAYCDCARAGGEKLQIVAAFTDGDADNLMVGRNGIFYDRQERDWDATITKIVAQPISIREAFWSPYKKLARLIEAQVQKRAQSADAEAQSKIDATAVAAANADKTQGRPEHTEKKIDVGTVAAIGVAIGGIGAMLTGILTAFFGLGLWMPIGILGVIILVSGPSMVLAWLKLRQRNLGPLLDASGWAVNGRARINVPFGAALTAVAALPKGAARSMNDPYAERKRPWGVYAFFATLVIFSGLWYFGKIDAYLPVKLRSVTVLGANAPAAAPAPAAPAK